MILLDRGQEYETAIMATDSNADLMFSKAARLGLFRLALKNMFNTGNIVEGLAKDVNALVQDLVRSFAKQAKKPVGFFDLPLELRRQIYTECLVSCAPIDLTVLPEYQYSHALIYVAKDGIARSKYKVAGKEDHRFLDIDPYTPAPRKPYYPDIDRYVKTYEPKDYLLAKRSKGRPSKRTKNDRNKSLLLVSKNISEEALNVLYGENTFGYDFSKRIRFQNLSLANQLRVKKMRIVFNLGFARTWQLEPVFAMEPFFWSPVLARLRKLEVVLLEPRFRQPWAYSVDMGTARCEMSKWLAWIPNHLEFLAKATSPTIPILVDDGIKAGTRESRVFVTVGDRMSANVPYVSGVPGAETRNIALSFFGTRYKEHRTLLGDFYYSRRENEGKIGE